MTQFRVPTVDAAGLTRARRLGEGGQGVIHLVSTPTEPELAYKEYLPTVQSTANWQALERQVEFRAGAGAEFRLWLDEHTAWPIRIVTEQEAPVGFLMRRAPGDCAIRLGGHAAPFAAEFLLNPLEYLHTVGISLSDADRVGVMRELARVLECLHAMGVAVGDLSPKNILIRLPPGPRCFLLDCDAMRIGAESALPQVETPDWRLPEGEDLGTSVGDVYKLGLFAVRLVAGDQSTRDIAALRERLPGLVDVVNRSLAQHPAERPGAERWVTDLDEVASSADTTVPVLMKTPPSVAEGRHYPARPRVRGWIAAAVAAVVAVICLVNVMRQGPDGGSSVGSNRASEVPPDIVVAQPSTSFGMVSFDGVANDPRALNVGKVLDTYFTGINNRQPEMALSAFDEQSVVDFRSERARAQFAKNVSTSTDSDVRIVSLSDGNGAPVAVVAVVKFQSTQQAGMGPARDPDETCTRWQITYELTERTLGEYRFYRSTGIGSPC